MVVDIARQMRGEDNKDINDNLFKLKTTYVGGGGGGGEQTFYQVLLETGFSVSLSVSLILCLSVCLSVCLSAVCLSL